MAPLGVGWGKVSLFSDFIRGNPRYAEEKYIKRVHCISFVLISEVDVWREHIFPYVIFVILNYTFCLRIKALRSLGSESKFGKSPTSDISRIVRE